MGWEIHQMDVKTTFLNGVIEEEVYIEQPEGFETHEKRTHVCKLKKALCGLKQAPRAWYGQIDIYLQQLGFIKSDAAPNLYYLLVEGELLILDGEIFLGQGRYASEILKGFRMQDCRRMAMPMITNWKKIDASGDKEVDPTLYRQLIGSLKYLVNTKPNLCYAVNTLSEFMVEPKRVHWATTKHILRYVCGTINFGLRYTKGNDIELSGFTNADWAGSSVDRKSTTWYCFDIGSGMTSSCSKKQKSVALSFAEAEYMAASKATCEAIWLRKLLVNLFRRRMESTRIFCDNQSCIELFENPVFHDHSKHIDIRCNFIRDRVQRGAVQLEYTPTGN
eukprot:PITA_32137